MNVPSFASDDRDSNLKKPPGTIRQLALRLKIRGQWLTLSMDVRSAVKQAITSEVIGIKRI